MPPVSGRRSDRRLLRVGAVAYDPKVVTIWEGFKSHFEKHGAPIDYVLYSTYDAQVEASLSGEIEVAWNSPLAWVKSQLVSHGECRAIAMRDTDRDLTTKILTRKASSVASLADLKGKTIAVGASDSPQATLIPLLLLADAGVVPGEDCHVVHHEVMVGRHGDHVGGERDAARALAAGDADAACVLDANYPVFINEAHSIRAPHACWPLHLLLTTAISPYARICRRSVPSPSLKFCSGCLSKILKSAH